MPGEPIPPPCPLVRDTMIPRRIGELDDDGLRPDTALPLAGARLVFADHALLQNDFPTLRDDALAAGGCPPDQCDAAREAWLLEHAALISVTQAAQDIANTPITTRDEPRRVWRPTRYGRAFLSDTGCGLLDLKGTGREPACAPALEVHSNGLLLMRDGLREILFQWVIDAVFRHAAPHFSTVPVYGFIDTGFGATSRSGAVEPAVIMVRRAHRRARGNVDLPVSGSRDEAVKVEIELLLRHYGITSANRGTRFLFHDEGELVASFAGTPVPSLSPDDAATVRGWMRGARRLAGDGMNIQTVRLPDDRTSFEAQLVDFGQYQVRGRFHDPLVSMGYGRLLNWSAGLWPEDPHFVQPVSALALSVERWGFGARSATDPERGKRKDGEGATQFTAALTRDFRDGRLTGGEVHRAMRDYIADTVRTWPRVAG
jgi:hypothetical protein